MSHGTSDFDAFAALVTDVFGIEARPAWSATTASDAAGLCVAGLQHAILTLRLAGSEVRCAAIRNVAVAVDWRGRGLMTRLFAHLLPRCDAVVDHVLLYTAAPAFYRRYGFEPLTQHAFEGEAPAPAGAATARRVEATRHEDLFRRLLATREPLSDEVFVTEDRGLTAHALGGDQWPIFHDATLDAIFIAGREDDTLVLADVVAAAVPSAGRILGALGERATRLRTLFPPDRLRWRGVPAVADAGLMIRGPVPAALQRPFILPPTVEF